MHQQPRPQARRGQPSDWLLPSCSLNCNSGQQQQRPACDVMMSECFSVTVPGLTAKPSVARLQPPTTTPVIAQLVERRTVEAQRSLGHRFKSGSRDSLFPPFFLFNSFLLFFPLPSLLHPSFPRVWPSCRGPWSPLLHVPVDASGYCAFASQTRMSLIQSFNAQRHTSLIV